MNTAGDLTLFAFPSCARGVVLMAATGRRLRGRPLAA